MIGLLRLFYGGAKLGNPKNLCLAGSIGRLAQAQAANEFATNLMPLVQAFQNARAVTLSQVASALNARAVSEQLGLTTGTGVR
jgi:hypothetical protein